MANQASKKSLEDRPAIASPTHTGVGDQKRSPMSNELEGSNAKRPRLSTDSKPIIRPTLSSSYRPTNRPLIDRMGLTSPALSSSTSSTFPTENIVTPTFPSGLDVDSSSSNSTFSSTTLPQSSIPSSNLTSLSSRLSDLKSSLPPPPPPPPSVHPLPARPSSLSTLPATNPDITSPVASRGPTASKSIPPTSSAIKLEVERPAAGKDRSDIDKFTTVEEPVESPSIEEIRRRADEVIARLTGSNPLSHDTIRSAPIPLRSGRAEESIHQKAEDVIARLEREARARESSMPSAIYRPPPQVFRPGSTPTRPPHYQVGVGMRPPPGWRPPLRFGPPPHVSRPPMVFRPPPAPPPQGWGSPTPPPTFHHSSPPRPPIPALIVPLRPSTTSPPPFLNISTTQAVHTPKAEAEAEEAVLLPKQRGSAKAPETTHTPNPLNQVYIGNLPQTTQLATLRKAFEALSPILTIELRAPFAMIEFALDGMAERAVDVYDEGTFAGVQIRVERAAE